MTRRDFELIANILRFPPLDNKQRTKMAHEIAEALSKSYPAFNSNKFLKACGVRHD